MDKLTDAEVYAGYLVWLHENSYTHTPLAGFSAGVRLAEKVAKERIKILQEEHQAQLETIKRNNRTNIL